MSYLDVLNKAKQTQPIVGKDMKKNNAGGYGFGITPQEQLERFILLGSYGGTFYLSELQLTEENAKAIIDYIKKDGLSVLSTVVDFAKGGKAPKADSGLFVLALCAKYGNEECKKLTYKAIKDVCITATHLFTFVSYVKALRGFSRGLRKGISDWYLSKNANQLAYQIVKYRERAGFSHRDVLRLCHAKPNDENIFKILGYAVGKVTAKETKNKLIRGYDVVKSDASEKELEKVIKLCKLTWEMIPNEKLNEPKILKALLENMNSTALIRNLNRFANAELTGSNNEVVKKIVSKLTNKEELEKANLHPINVLNYLSTYKQGHGFKGNTTWEVNRNIVDALTDTFDISLKALVPTNKKILLGVDVSGSMSHTVDKTAMSASTIATVLAYVTLRTEKEADLVFFDEKLIKSTIGRKSSLEEVLRYRANGGGTDCSLPIKYALENELNYDVIIIYTDSETYAGNRHGISLLEEYRRKVNPNVKVIEVALVSNGCSTFPSDDKNVIRAVGFDSSLPQLINKLSE